MDTIECRVKIEFGGTNTEGTVTVNLPFGLSMDTAKILDTNSAVQTFGDGRILDTGTTAYMAKVVYSSSTAVQLRHFNDSSTFEVLSSTDTSGGSPMTIASGDIFIMNFSVPISGWE
jgi:hypothetical protein